MSTFLDSPAVALACAQVGKTGTEIEKVFMVHAITLAAMKIARDKLAAGDAAGALAELNETLQQHQLAFAPKVGKEH